MNIRRRPSFTITLPAALVLLTSGCGDRKEDGGQPSRPDAPEKSASAPEPRVFWSEVKLHGAVRERNPDYTGNGQFQIDQQTGTVTAIGLADCHVADVYFMKGMDLQALDLSNGPVEDISALQGMGLKMLALENTKVADLSALAGNTTLQELYLAGSKVTDLSPLRQVPVQKLNLVNTHVTDLSPLAGKVMDSLWLTGAPLEDISPLRSCRLVSLTLHKTKVRDLSPLSGTALQRLHIGETPVTDLSPLAGMNLTRLVFNRERINKGIEAVKSMRSLQEIGSRYDEESDLVHPAVFWSNSEGPTPPPVVPR